LLADLRDAGTVADLERIVEADPDNAPTEVLETAFVQHFPGEAPAFDKTLFHFLLTRLGATQSRIAVDYCLGALRSRPEETPEVLMYFKKIGLQDNEHERIVEFLNSDASLYEYQNYLLLKYYFELRLPYRGIVAVCRRYVRDLAKPHWLRAYAAALIGVNGNAADMEFFEAQYGVLRDGLERATCICCTVAMEARRRNELLGRARHDGEMEERAVRWVRAQDA
jgi:hypothetical protein